MSAIAKILRNNANFTSIYEDIASYEVFNLSVEEMKSLLYNVIPTCDLVLSQPVSNEYKENSIYSTATLRSNIKKGATHLIIPNCYFTGYDPVPFQATNSNHNIINCDGISYYPSVSLTSLLQNDIKKACVDWCNIKIYSDSDISNNFQRTICELKMRESKVFDNDFAIDVSISDYIEANYKDKFLFHTYNHPTNELLFELTRRILKRMGIDVNEIEKDINVELLGDISIPPCLSVYIKSKFKFKYPDFIIFGKVYPTFQVMQLFDSCLSKFPVHLHEQWRCCVAYGRFKLLEKI
jgi:hypothetical protein